MLEKITEKQCTICGETKSISEFNKQTIGKYGVRSHCKECRKNKYESEKEQILKRVKNYRDNNRELIADRKKKFAKDNREKIAEYKKQYQTKNKIKISIKKKQYHQNNKSKILEYHNNYRKTENGRAVVNNLNMKRRQRERCGDVTAQQLLMLQQNANNCYWCNKSLKNKKVHIDHYVPLSKGGEHTLSNLVVSCDKCNLSKGSKNPDDFAKSIGKLF